MPNQPQNALILPRFHLLQAHPAHFRRFPRESAGEVRAGVFCYVVGRTARREFVAIPNGEHRPRARACFIQPGAARIERPPLPGSDIPAEVIMPRNQQRHVFRQRIQHLRQIRRINQMVRVAGRAVRQQRRTNADIHRQISQ